jgi:D-glycero-D-manno-heptose 1,7-bisphosphate phosphatase
MTMTEQNLSLTHKHQLYWAPAIFLDRDGVVIDFVDYISNPSDVRVNRPIVELIRVANQRSWRVVVVTNQSGLGRGYFELDDYFKVDAEMKRQLTESGVYLDQVLFAPYIQNAAAEIGQLRAEDRKPWARNAT